MKKIGTLLALLAVTTVSAQYNYRDSNRIGIGGGINQFDLMTNDIDATPGMGWNLGLSMRGNFYNDFDMVYGIQFSENKFKVATTSLTGGAEDVEFKLPSAQISLLLSYKIIESHLSVELGPMIQVNGKLTYDEQNEMNILRGTTVTADEFTEVSKFNFYPTIGVTAGLKQLRVAVMYHYGVNNILSGVSGADGEKLKANAGIISANLLIYL